ncbi:NmrA-like protein [Ceraceosorus guamensis]|uniref:NmrA-like protein n=1 Tax=Ceraceosorus guamensis TaxID=1522189 RepID=A0A316WA48_9BASI|nr:NmrA-like protein [Ceraceosorus guamensis]PWN44853.1 NmrA-like protein [Ceraceosorus guamensis]
MSQPQKSSSSTLVIGAGELGLAVIEGLMTHASGASPHPLHVLLRPTASDAGRRKVQHIKDKGADVVHGDLADDSIDALASIFAAYSTVICCSGFVGGSGTQRKITTAVLQADVQRYVPWQFGVDYEVIGRGSGQPVWDEQLDVRDMLRAQSKTQWIIISSGMFTSFLFEPSFGLVDFERAEVRALGSWDYRLTVTTPADIGKLTAAILAHEPPIRNQVVFTAGDTLSYTQLADVVEQHLGRQVRRVLLSLDQLRSDSASRPDDLVSKYRLAFARDTGVAWTKEQTFNAAQGIAVTDARSYLRQRQLE